MNEAASRRPPTYINLTNKLGKLLCVVYLLYILRLESSGKKIFEVLPEYDLDYCT